jgi:hypothetical protein
MPTLPYKVACVGIITFSSLLSVIGSTAIVVSSWKGIDSVYQRLIVMISVLDHVTSISYIVHPYMLPHYLRSMGIPWASGNDVTFTMAGFLLNAGPLLIAFYCCYLSVYFYWKVKYNMTDATIRKKYQRPANVVASFVSFGYTNDRSYHRWL